MKDPLDAIQVGQKKTLTHKITKADVEQFSKLTGDNNPLHMEEEYAKSTDYHGRVVHGMLTASFISTIIGTKLPGRGALWLKQSLSFLKPVRIGDKVIVEATVLKKSKSTRTLVLRTRVFDQYKEMVIDGQAKVLVAKPVQAKAPAKEPAFKVKGCVIITGGTRGIGREVALRLVAQGRPLLINYFSNEDAADKLETELKKREAKVCFVKGDIRDVSCREQLVDSAISEFGIIHGLVNNASQPVIERPLEDTSWADVQSQLAIHAEAPMDLMQRVVPYMVENGWGSIVNLGSIAIDTTPKPMADYTMAKTLLLMLTRYYAKAYGPKGVRCNMVSPGFVRTELINRMASKGLMMTKMQTPLRALAEATDIASMIVYLLSKDAGHITGQNIRIDGGYTA